MNETVNMMLLIKSIDKTAHLELSEATGKWYVASRVDICGNGMLTGIVEHREYPQDAVSAYFERLKAIERPLALAVMWSNQRREFNWNGAAFAEHIR